MSKLTKEKIIGKKVTEVFPGVNTTEIFNVFKRVWETGISEHCPVFQYKDSRIDGWRDNFVYKLPTGEIVALYDDLTESKKTEEALRESERLLVESQRIGNLGSWAWDINSKRGVWSEPLYTIYGWDSDLDAPSSDAFFEFFHPDDRARVLKTIEMAMNNKDVHFSTVYRYLRKENGEERLIYSQGKVEKDENGTPNRMLGISQNITEKRKLEENLQKSQKLNSLGVLAGGIAHDFNNLLGGILGNIELAMMKTTEENVSSYLARSLGSIDRTRVLTGQLLTFAKGGAPIKRVESLFPFVQETILFALSGSSVFSQFQIEEDLWPCDFDRNRIGQVIENITTNAQQAMADGGIIEIAARNISLSAKEHQSLAAGNYVKLSITDHGIGMSKEILPSIFDPYYTTKSMGQGLGLSICYSIISRHGGSIDVESELGKGSAFHVYLPASIESVLAIAEDHTEQGSCEHRGSGTFLVMDDEELIRESMKDILEDFGYTVVLKENGQDAIDFFMEETSANRKLAGMIFDLTIPGGMGGKEAIGEIRKICLDTPAFVASGYSPNPVIAEPEEYGFNASLCKPFLMVELSEMLEKHMKKN